MKKIKAFDIDLEITQTQLDSDLYCDCGTLNFFSLLKNTPTKTNINLSVSITNSKRIGVFPCLSKQ